VIDEQVCNNYSEYSLSIMWYCSELSCSLYCTTIIVGKHLYYRYVRLQIVYLIQCLPLLAVFIIIHIIVFISVFIIFHIIVFICVFIILYIIVFISVFIIIHIIVFISMFIILRPTGWIWDLA